MNNPELKQPDLNEDNGDGIIVEAHPSPEKPLRSTGRLGGDGEERIVRPAPEMAHAPTDEK